VDPCQPTQSYNVGGGSQHWSGSDSGRVQSIRIDSEEHDDQAEHNVDVGLSLQGQFY
jgi:hypothetical protein